MDRRGSGASWALPAQYVALAGTWGSSFLFMRIGLTGLSPTQLVLARMVVGAVALAVVTGSTRQPLPREPVIWGHLAVLSVLLCVAPFLLFAWAQQYVSSGLASIYNATTPLMTTAVAFAALRQERPASSHLTGLGIGFLGVLVVLGPWHGVAGGSVLAQGACLLATACYGTAFVYLRRFVSPRGVPAVAAATVQVGVGAVVMLLLAPFVAVQPLRLTAPVVVSTLALGVLGTGLAYVWNTNVVAGWGATNASTVTYLTPVVGVVLGILVLGEDLHWSQPVGAAVLVLGIAVCHGRLPPVRVPVSRQREPAP